MLNKFREAEAIIPYREQNHREHFHQGEPLRAVLKRVEETPKGPRLILSRGDPLFVKALFKLEVPEIQQNIVEIRAAAREVGSRTKIAVFSRDDSIDPVGACVGLKGSRVQAVVNELNGERIDIVPWSPDPERFAKLALAPAKVARVFSDPTSKTIQAVVDEDQLSLAIGRNGQNVRLASELTGWKIDLYSSREWMERGGAESQIFAPLPEETEETADVRLSDITGMPPATVAVLEEAGYRTLNDIIDLEREDFLKLPGIAPEEADRIMALIDEVTTEDGGSEEGRPENGGSTAACRAVTSAMDDSVRQRLWRLLGLGVRGRGVVVGVKQVREAARKNKVSLAVVASDASRNSVEKIVPLLNARRVRFLEVPSAAELGAAVGRDQTAVVGIVDPQLAAGVRELMSSGSPRATEEGV